MSGRAGRANGSGRKAGTPNKKTADLLERSKKLGIDPFTVLLMFCKRDWKGLGYKSGTILKATKSGECFEVDVITPDNQLTAACAAAQYMYPKRKAIEVKEDPGNRPRPLKDLSDDELDDL